MPLKTLRFKPGVDREGTALSTEGAWFECDKVRFRSGYPQKIGGWQSDSGITTSSLLPPEGGYWGVARAMLSWQNLSNYNLLGIATHLKLYIQNTSGGLLNDVTPLRLTSTVGAVTFAATNGSPVLTVTHAGHGAQTNDFVTFSGAAGLGGVVTAGVLNKEHQISRYVSSNSYEIVLPLNAQASDVGNGGASVVGVYQATSGADVYTVGVGWGAGGWGGNTDGSSATGWGVSAPSGVGLGIQLRTWSLAPYGQDMIANPRGGALYYWKNNANPAIFDRADRLGPTASGAYQTDAECPSVCNFVLVTDISRFVIAFGVNDYGSAVQDPLLVRWSEQEDYTTWVPSITNQAGSIRLNRGTEIVTAQQTRQEVLVWTDSALYSMQYQGPPAVWSLQVLGENTSIVSPQAVVTAQDVTYWMGVDKFYAYNGRVSPLPSTLREYVFSNFNPSQRFQVCAGVNEAFNEVWWFYCSANSTAVDRYVVYNYVENLWYYGTMARTAWTSSPLRGGVVAAGYGGQFFYHERGTDDGSTNPPSPMVSYIQSSDVDIDDGNNFGFVWRLLPDVNFNGSQSPNPKVQVSLRPRRNSGVAYGSADSPYVQSANNYSEQRTYDVQRFTPQVNVRVRGRQMAFRIGSQELGVAWQLGVPRADIRMDGKR
jgi:hypothetical protein